MFSESSGFQFRSPGARIVHVRVRVLGVVYALLETTFHVCWTVYEKRECPLNQPEELGNAKWDKNWTKSEGSFVYL